MLLLSSNFTLPELIDSQTASRKGIDNYPSPTIMLNLQYTCRQLETVRIVLGTPILISSGYRSPQLNKEVGGSNSSQHLEGRAVDFTSPRFGAPRNIVDRLKDTKIPFDQLILEYDRWVHISFVEGSWRKQVLEIDSAGTRTYT